MEKDKLTTKWLENVLNAIFNYKAIMEDADDVTITAGKLHKFANIYTNCQNRMPMCCEAMKNVMLPDDEILSEPPSGQSSTVSIKYKLPRT